MRLKEFEYPIDKRINKLQYKYEVDKRLVFLVFYCVKNGNNISINAQFESPSFRKLECEPISGPAAYAMNEQRIAELLGLEYIIYREKLLNDFNAYTEFNIYTNMENIYFYSDEDAIKAFEWIESIVFFDTFYKINK